MPSIDVKNSIGRKLQEDFCSFCSEAAGMFEKFPFLREAEKDLLELRKSIIHPFNFAVFGRMKTGKSSFVNTLRNKHLAVTGVEEATATINVITYSNSPDKLDHFTVHWKDAPPETFPIQDLQLQWRGKTACDAAHFSNHPSRIARGTTHQKQNQRISRFNVLNAGKNSIFFRKLSKFPKTYLY